MSSSYTYSPALCILCQVVPLIKERGMDKPEIYTREWWKEPFGETVGLAQKIRDEIGEDLPAELERLISWFEGEGDLSPETIVELVAVSNEWLKRMLSRAA